MARRRPVRTFYAYLVVIFIVSAFLFHTYFWPRNPQIFRGISPDTVFTDQPVEFMNSTDKLHAKHAAANATLEFGAILAVSPPNSVRKEKLLQQAAVSGLNITVLDQPVWTSSDLRNFRWRRPGKVSDVAARRWLSHAQALKWMIKSGLETVLIVEDDIDWDIHLRTTQIPETAAAWRALIRQMNDDGEASPDTPEDEEEEVQEYWGDTREWDMMFLGHCGDFFDAAKSTSTPPLFPRPSLSTILAYNDPSLPDLSSLHPFTRAQLSNLSLPSHTRIIHRSVYPTCSIAYALTNDTASRLLNSLAPISLFPAHHESPVTAALSESYPHALLSACATYLTHPLTPTNSDLKCWTITPQLTHHIVTPAQISALDRAGRQNEVSVFDRVGVRQSVVRGETSNIECGFRDGGFHVTEGDEGRLEWLRTEIEGGRCVKGGREG